jgi:hypothetical protein
MTASDELRQPRSPSPLERRVPQGKRKSRSPVSLAKNRWPTGVWSVDISGVAADGTTTVSAHADAPYYSKHGQFYCSNVAP